MTNAVQKIVSTEFTVTLLTAFALMFAGKCFAQQTPVSQPAPKSFVNYVCTLSIQPEKDLYSLSLEVGTEAEIALTLWDTKGVQVGEILKKTMLHSGVYTFDLGQKVKPGSIYLLTNESGKTMRFEVPAVKAAAVGMAEPNASASIER